MKHALTTTMGLVGGTAAAYHFLARPRILRRGATKEEVNSVLPGDEITPPNPFRSTMATTIDATPEEIWPWLVQVGWERGAFYSYNRIEALFGMDLHNAERIHPEWQNLEIGDTMWMSHPRMKALFPETKAVTIDPHRALVFAIHGPDGTDGAPTGAWSFVLNPIDETSTRLISRLQVSTPSLVGKLVFYGFEEPAHFIMQDGMFRGLKERLREANGDRPEEAAVIVG
jgi:hypothetical protein